MLLAQGQRNNLLAAIYEYGPFSIIVNISINIIITIATIIVIHIIIIIVFEVVVEIVVVVVVVAGLEKYLNSTLPIGQVTLKFCLSGALPLFQVFKLMNNS